MAAASKSNTHTEMTVRKQISFELNDGKKYQVSSFQGRIVAKLAYHRAHHNVIRALFYRIIDALIRAFKSNKIDLKAPTKLTPWKHYMLAKAHAAQIEMARVSEEEYILNLYTNKVNALNSKINDKTTSPAERDRLKKQLEDLKKNQITFIEDQQKVIKKSKADITQAAQTYAAWNKQEQLLEELKKINENSQLKDAAQITILIQKQLEHFPMEDLKKVFSEEKESIKGLEKVITTLEQMINNREAQKNEQERIKTEFLKAKSMEMVTAIQKVHQSNPKELIIKIMNIAESFPQEYLPEGLKKFMPDALAMDVIRLIESNKRDLNVAEAQTQVPQTPTKTNTSQAQAATSPAKSVTQNTKEKELSKKEPTKQPPESTASEKKISAPPQIDSSKKEKVENATRNKAEDNPLSSSTPLATIGNLLGDIGTGIKNTLGLTSSPRTSSEEKPKSSANPIDKNIKINYNPAIAIHLSIISRLQQNPIEFDKMAKEIDELEFNPKKDYENQIKKAEEVYKILENEFSEKSKSNDKKVLDESVNASRKLVLCKSLLDKYNSFNKKSEEMASTK